MNRSYLVYCLMTALMITTAGLTAQVTDKEIFGRLREADMMARSGKKQDEALKAYIACLEDSHRFELPAVGAVALNLSIFSETYPPARDAIVKYLRGWVSKAYAGRLSPRQMFPLEAMAGLTKREDILVDSFIKVMAAQKTDEQKQAWGQTCFDAMFKAERYPDLHRHFDMVADAQAQLKRWQNRKMPGTGSMAVGFMRETFNAYLDVYREVGDKDGAEKMTGLLRRLEE